MSKIITREAAAKLIRDHDTLITTGFNGFGCPEDLIYAIEDRFDLEGHPKNLTLVKCTSQGDGKGRGISHLADKEGMFDEIIASHIGYDPGIYRLVSEDRAACFMLPLGNMMMLFRSIAAGLPGAIAVTGIGTFADPRNGGGRINAKAKASKRNFVELMTIGGTECLYYPSFPINICFLKASLADYSGNLSFRNEAVFVEQFEVAAATHNSGGIVVAQVDRIVENGELSPKEIQIHGSMIDYIVEGDSKFSCQSFATDAYRPEICGNGRSEISFGQLDLDVRKVCCRRAAMELTPGALINLGIGMPGGIGSVAEEEGIADLFTLSMESGPLGGVPLAGVDFGASVNAECFYRMADILTLYDGGALDMAVLGFAEIDKDGNVNAHSFNGRTVGAGGFIDITQNVRKLCFIGTFTAGKKLDIKITDDRSVQIDQEGDFVKFRSAIENITFSGVESRKKGQEVLVITERAVFRLEENGLTLIEIAKGVDLDRDILAHMEFRPQIAEQLKMMDERLFGKEAMGIRPELLS